MGCSFNSQTTGLCLMHETSGYLIDWLTLRLPISTASHPAIYSRLSDCIGHLVCSDASGQVQWVQRTLDIEALRSDSQGLFWQIKSDGKTDLLVIAASPASLQHGLNVWGTLDIRHSAKTLIDNASRCLQLLLPGVDHWQARRIDITANYALPDAASVKHALTQLLVSSGARRRPSSKKGGDTVYWNFSSDLSKGKAYHKGPQVLHLWKKSKVEVDEEKLQLLNRVIRLEHTRGARWFRRLIEARLRWQDLQPQQLIDLHTEFFQPLIGEGIEMKNMEREQIVQTIIKANGCTENQARAAFNTYRNVRQDGYETTRAAMASRTWYLHQRLLRIAGISDQHLRDAIVVPFPRVRFVLAQPVASWDDIRRAA